ncbi:hypothetical protein CHS0354_039309 [Potamilus streckersoni]|uniref:Ig-like domain-containing protein n=1 Tax=Potamilus streckersoni TaxID=2493646 RepID=A0AAE0SXW7_9BIVA|nr:hypothetical protein CHS0354_039309 [Potamilus streckersoni]
MSPLLLYLAFCYLTIYTVTEGKTVRGIVGRNASFSFTFMNGDIIEIQHNHSDFAVVWPDTYTIIDVNQPDRVKVVIGNKTASNTTTVTISFLNLTNNDSGMYSAMRRINRTKILDRIVLEMIDERLIPKIEKVPNYSLDSALVLMCKVSSTSTRKVLWRLNGSVIENRNSYFHKDTYMYISNLTADDKYNIYTCKESGSEVESDPYRIQICKFISFFFGL